MFHVVYLFPSELFDTMATAHAKCRTAHFISCDSKD